MPFGRRPKPSVSSKPFNIVFNALRKKGQARVVNGDALDICAICDAVRYKYFLFEATSHIKEDVWGAKRAQIAIYYKNL